MGAEELSVEEIRRQLELLSVEPDYDQLCADGILERVGKNRFKVPDGRRLPEYLGSRIIGIGPGNNVKFEDTVKWARKRLNQLRKEE